MKSSAPRRRLGGLLPMWCLCCCLGGCTAEGWPAAQAPWALDEGAVVRGDVSNKVLTIVFTGGEFGEGAEHILDYEEHDSHGLNGFFLLLHTGSQRRDKMHLQLAPLLREILARGYTVVRVDELLDRRTPHRAW